MTRMLVWGISAIILIGVIITMAKPTVVTVEATEAQIGVFRETLTADGVLRSQDQYTVSAPSEGDLQRIELKVGDSVLKDQVIAKLALDLMNRPVRAPISGIVSQVFRESAGPIHRGEPIIKIINPDHLEAVAEILTTDAVRISIGSTVALTGWGGPAPIQAKVSKISKAGFTKPSALGVEEERTEITALLQEIPKDIAGKLGSQFHVEFLISVAEKPDTLKIPTGAVFRDGAKWMVYKMDQGKAKKTEIQILGRSNEEVAIAAGLRDHDQVILYPGDLVKDQIRVTTKH